MSRKRPTTRIALFLKNPQPGRVKTRLAKTTGFEVASLLYRQMIWRTLEVVRETALPASLYVDPGNALGLFKVLYPGWSSYRPQKGRDLGERMFQAFTTEVNEHAGNLILIGSDCMALCPRDILQARDILKSQDCAIGPSLDGGYYLIGIRGDSFKARRQDFRRIFSNIPWSQATVYQETLRRLKKLALGVGFLDQKGDIDQARDLSVGALNALYPA